MNIDKLKELIIENDSTIENDEKKFEYFFILVHFVNGIIFLSLAIWSPF
jgi:hypothetical protein